MAYCDFCQCSMCQTGCGDVIAYHGDDPPTRIVGELELHHTQCEDGRWICDTCYYYECCVDAGSDPGNGLCGEKKCAHRPKLVNGEWTFWTYHLGVHHGEHPYVEPEK